MPNNDGNIVKRTTQYIDNMSFDETTELPMVEIAGTDGTGSVYRVRVDANGNLISSAGTAFSVNDQEEGTTSYYGFTASDGEWQVRKITDTLVSYATETNNGSVTSYTDAWTNRATLTYGRYDQAF